MCYVPAVGQYAVDFSRVYGGSLIDEGAAVDVNPVSQMVVVGGRSFSSDEYLHENAGGSDFWIMQMTPDGDTIWSRSYGGSNNDDIHVIRYNTNNNGITAFGTTYSQNGDVPAHPGQIGAWLLRTDLAGNILGSVVYSGILGEEGVDFVQLPDGGYILLVRSTSPMLEGAQNHGNFDYWLARVNSTGLVQWARFFGGGDADLAARLVRVPLGVIVVGSSESSDGDVSENKGGFDYWVLRVDLTGELVWERSFGGSGDDIARDAALMPDGTVMIVGESDSEDGDRTQSFGGTDVWLVRIDQNGNLLWQRSYGGSLNDSGRRIVPAGETRLAMLAHSHSKDGDLSSNKGRQDVWLSFLHADNGNIIQQMNYGGSQDDYGRGLAISADSVLYMAGSSLSINGNLPFPGLPEEDLWLMRLSVPQAPCANNFQCFLFDDVNFAVLRPETNGGVVCVNGCNAGANKGPTGPAGCTNFLGPAAWFKVKTDANAEVITLQVTTPEFNIPQISVMQGLNCTNITQVNCVYGQDGASYIINLTVDPDTAYYVVVGDGTGMQGRFNLCVSALNIDFCNIDPEIYVNQTSMGSPLSGPFQPGEEVQICYEVRDWDKLDCNGLQGIVPEFGPGWDSTSFNSMGRPIQIDSMLTPVSANGEWSWWTVGSVQYNFTNPVFGINGGASLPVGWYFVNYNHPPPNDNPNQSIGDLNHCVSDNSMWKVCFTLKTRFECTENLDCFVSVKTYADGEIGAVVSQACQNDPPVKLNATLNCCHSPFIYPIQDVTICSGDTVLVEVLSTLNPPATYAYMVNVNGNITGAQGGFTNNFIFNKLTNLGTEPGTVTYTVSGTSGTCSTPTEQFTVTVRPMPSATMTRVGPSTICSGEQATVRFDFVGEAPYFAVFAINGVIAPPVFAESTPIMISVPVTEPALFNFVSYNDRNCGGTTNGSFNVTVLPHIESFVNLEICQGESVQVGGQTLTLPGSYLITLENGASNGCDSIIHLDLTVHRRYVINLDLQICEGESVTVGSNVYTESGIYQDFLFTIHGCDSIINLALTVTNEIVVQQAAVICPGVGYPFGGMLLFQSGTYNHTVPITGSCDSVYVLNLNVLPVIVLIQTVIQPDTGQNSGSILIQVAGGIPPYSYLWSTGDTTNHPTGLTPGNYGLTVTDALGCMGEFNFFVGTSSVDLLPGLRSINVFPNPVKEKHALYVTIGSEPSLSMELVMRVLDIHGVPAGNDRRVLSTESEQTITLDVGHRTPGIYLLQILDPVSGASSVRRFVIQ